MIIVKGTSYAIGNMTEKAEAILFTFEGVYFYVESGIMENELRVLRNWRTADCPGCHYPWHISRVQGDQIPQELGDWLVAHQDNKQTPNETEQANNQGDN